jgi:hypothetical protein
VRGETVAVVDSVEQLVVRHRVAGIQRSFTQVLKDSSEKRAAAAEAATGSSSRRPLRDQAQQSIVNRILKEVGVRPTSPSSALPEEGAAEEGRRGESRQLLKEPDKQKSWYQKAASKIGLKTSSSGDTAAAIVVTEEAAVQSAEEPMRESKSIPNVASKEGDSNGTKFESPELKKKTEREGFVCRERTESVCSDNLPDLSLVQEDRLEADKPYLDEEVSTNAAEAEQSRQGSFPASPLLLVRELDKSGLFLTSFDHDEEEDEEDLDLMSRISETAADHVLCQEELPCGSPAPHLEAMRPMLKEQVSLLLEAVLRPPEAAKQTGRQLREHVEESLVEKITDVINRTLSDQAAAVQDFDPVICPAVPKSSTAEKDEETDMSMALESRDMSMALARVENSKADCDCCGDGDMSEQENVYDVFDLREDKKSGDLKSKKKYHRLWVTVIDYNCSTTGKPTRSFATERVSLDSV